MPSTNSTESILTTPGIFVSLAKNIHGFLGPEMQKSTTVDQITLLVTTGIVILLSSIAYLILWKVQAQEFNTSSPVKSQSSPLKTSPLKTPPVSPKKNAPMSPEKSKITRKGTAVMQDSPRRSSRTPSKVNRFSSFGSVVDSIQQNFKDTRSPRKTSLA